MRLDRRADLLRSGILATDRPGESELARRISLPRNDGEVMPAIGDPLARREVSRIRQWIAEGANWPERFEPGRHWAYLPPRRPAASDVSRPGWIRTGIDRFVLQRLDEEGLQPAPRARPETLVRRLFLDLIGLPPTPEEVERFLMDSSDAGVARLVDELLKRPQFGERWARPWLDLARYADSHGFQRDDWRDVWAYRDWVIRALNADMPFDQFTIEQIAGDLLPAATESQRTATGFHRCAPTNCEAGSLPEETRVEQVIDRVNTTAAVWLGTTLECAQCHDHKYDPFTMTDYYRLLAFFNSTELEADRTNPKVPSSIQFRGPFMELSDEARRERRTELEERRTALDKRREARREQLAADLEAWAAEFVANRVEAPERLAAAGMPDGVRERSGGETARRDAGESMARLAARRSSTWSRDERRQLLDYRLSQDAGTQAIAHEIAELEKLIEELAPQTTLVMIELNRPRRSSIFERGDYRKPAGAVSPGTPEILHPMPPGPANRLALARWLVDPANPLVARGTVNRWWAELFGRGIVATVEDFGAKGEPPTHAELLDWLAVELIENDWSMKHLLKTIVLSATYQQSSRVTPEQLERDDLNRLLARGPRFRMDAEMIRDNALAISGILNLKQFGPPIRPYQPEGIWEKVGGMAYEYVVSPGDEQYRRGIYVVLKRGSPYPSFVNFDGSARLTCTVSRSRTNTPLQALTLLNDPVYVDAARGLAQRVMTATNGLPLDQRLSFAFRLCTARHPAEIERRMLRRLFQNQRSASRRDPEAARRLSRNRADSESAADFSAWYSVATVLLNLHETITKE